MKKQTFTPVTPNINFPEMEKRILREWYELGIVDKYLHRNDGATKRFSFLDGPEEPWLSAVKRAVINSTG